MVELWRKSNHLESHHHRAKSLCKGLIVQSEKKNIISYLSLITLSLDCSRIYWATFRLVYG